MKRALVTGANGFIGRRLCPYLVEHGWNVVAALRTAAPGVPELKDCELYPNARLDSVASWAPVVKDVDAIVHLAARAHVMKDDDPDPLQAYRRVNCHGALDLARLAARLGVGRFVFLSTIKVHGEHTASRPFTESDVPAPVDPYAVSKWEAEQGLAEIAATTGLKVVALRPPLVYGPWVRGNFLRLMGLVRRRVPLPLASVVNRRSLVGVGNLASAIEQWIAAPAPPTGTFLVSDDHDLSTPQLVRLIGAAMGVRPILFQCPPALLLGLGRIAGRSGEFSRITESLLIDCTRMKQELRWRPPFSVEEGITESVQSFLRNS